MSRSVSLTVPASARRPARTEPPGCCGCMAPTFTAPGLRAGAKRSFFGNVGNFGSRWPAPSQSPRSAAGQRTAPGMGRSRVPGAGCGTEDVQDDGGKRGRAGARFVVPPDTSGGGEGEAGAGRLNVEDDCHPPR